MYRIEEIAALLQREHVRAEDVAKLYQDNGDRVGDGYNIHPANSPVHEVVIGLKRDKHTLSLPPEYVKLNFDVKASVELKDAVPFCNRWNPTAGTVEQPAMYICRPPKHGTVSVVVFAALTDSIDQADARVSEIMLRRDLP